MSDRDDILGPLAKRFDETYARICDLQSRDDLSIEEKKELVGLRKYLIRLRQRENDFLEVIQSLKRDR